MFVIIDQLKHTFLRTIDMLDFRDVVHILGKRYPEDVAARSVRMVFLTRLIK